MPFAALPAIAPAVAAAAPAAVAKATLMATLKSVAFKAITNLAISAAMSALQPLVGGQSGRTFEFVIDPDGPIPFAAGRVGVAGSVIHRDTFGPDLMYYGMPFVLSGAGPITAIESFMADDYPMSFDANGGATTEPYRQELFFRSVLGHQPAPAALTTPSGLKNGATLPGWTASHKLSGKAAGLIVMAENSKGSAFPTGEIKPLIQLLGLKGWDPTLDSTYPGGSGPCRLHDPSTWVTLTCPILWALKWSLGLWEGPNGKGAPQVDHQVGGIGAKLSGIDVPAFVAASNIAKANGWTVSAYPNTDDDKHQVLEAFLQAGGAIYSQRAGKISCISRAAPRTSIVTISAADTAGPLEIDTAASRIDRINTIRPRFWSPAHRWQMTAMEEVTAASYQTEDGGKRTRGIDYPFVSDAKQAGQLAALQIANTREGIAGVIPLKPHLQRIRPGDAFTITEAGFVLNGLKCLCLNTDYDPATGVVRVSFVSETDGKYPFALGQNPNPPTPQVLEPVDPRHVSPPGSGDWTITPRPPSGGAQLPGFDLSGFVSNDTATAIIVETGPSATGPWKQAYQGPPTVTNIPIDGLQPGATYFIAIQYQRNQNYSEREVFGPFTAPDLVAGDLSPESPVWTEIELQGVAIGEVTGRLQTVEDIAEANAQAVADLEEVYGDTVSAAASAASATQQAAIATQAKADAIIAEGGALEAKADAIAARADAILAEGSAADRASEATQERIKAETARGQAEGFRNQSAASATTATGAASTATEQAGLAATARGEAQGFAGSALDYRNQASGFVTAAEAAAAVSTTQKLEAVAALNAMGRQNIVARENVTTPADVFTITTGGVSGWGFSMVGSGGNVTRNIKVGPLKANTAYSISFKARRTSGSGSLPISVDLYPDTLPERTFDIQSSALTEFKWENITSPSTDMALATVLLRFFRASLPTGYAYEITDIKLEEGATATAWTPSPKDAATSARASAKSASQASASETAAGQQAATATQERIDAQTARGQAEGFRNQSAASASTATGAASTATEQAGLAATARGEAQGFAGAALDYRNQASGFVTDAETAAAASSASSVTATASKDAAKNYAINQGSITPSALLWTNNPNGAPETATDATYPVVTVGGKPSMILGDNQHVFWKRAVPFVAGHVYEIQVEAEPSTASAAEISLIIWQLDGSYANLPAQNYQLTSKSIPVRGLYTQRFTPNAATVWLRPAVKGEMVGSKNPRIFSLNIIDVTAQAAAEASATAASTSASSAAASETAAGQSASAANTAEVAAETARGQAQTAATNAATSETNAAGSASTAANQATLATDARNAADDAAEAAAGSASTASSKADEAGVQASAALASQVSATASRDQALKALLEQGRTNLVRRTRATAGQVVATSEGLSGWGFSMVGTGSGSQERSIAVGPLKQNTPYSLSFWARRLAGAGSRPITFDLFPDTLPERAFDIQSNVWTRYTWENFSSAHADMTLSSVRARFFRPNMEAGVNVEIAAVKIEEGATATVWTPSPFDAADSASAAATSAANASASDTAAGQKAAAADGSAVAAGTRAAEAKGFRDQSAVSETNAAGSAASASQSAGTAAEARNQAVDAKDQSISAAATSQQARSDASAFAASAQISADLAASVNRLRGNLIHNSTGADGLRLWGGALSSYFVQTNAGFGPRFETKLNGTQTIFSDYIEVDGSRPFVLSGILYRNAAGGTVNVDVAWETAAGGVTYSPRLQRTTNVSADSEVLSVALSSPPGAVRCRVRIFTESVTGNIFCGALRLKLERGALPATGWTDEATDAGLAASLSIVQAVAADAQSRLSSARFEVIAAAGSDPAQLLIRADSTDSLAALVATSIRFSNVIGGQIVEAMKLIGGEVFFMRPIYIDVGDKRLIVGPGGTWVLWFGNNDKNAAAASRTNGYFALGTDGQVYLGGLSMAGGFRATSDTGFIGGGRTGAGHVQTSNTVNVTVSGGTSGTQIRWIRISGDTRIRMNDEGAFSTGAYATIGTGEAITAYFMGLVTRGSLQAVVYVQVDLADTGT